MPRETRSDQPGLAGVGGAGSSVLAVPKGVFRKEGEYWTVGYGGNSFRLKDTKGLGYLAHLLRHPGVEFHVLDLAGGIAGQRDDDETDQSARGLPRTPESRCSDNNWATANPTACNPQLSFTCPSGDPLSLCPKSCQACYDSDLANLKKSLSVSTITLLPAELLHITRGQESRHKGASGFVQ